jgi:phage-related protein
MFKFKNISSTDMKFLVEEEDNFIAKASQRINTINIDGRDGSIYNELGYSNIDIPIKGQILDNSKLDDILAWLNGEGALEYEDRITTARFYGDIRPQRNATIKIANFRFIRDPFWYKKDDDFVSILDEYDELLPITNEGSIASRPIIRIEKGEDDSIDATIGGVRFYYYFGDEEYEEGDEYVEIDCETMEATYEGLNRNRQLAIGYDYPLLPVGESEVVIHSGDATVLIKRKDRWL